MNGNKKGWSLEEETAFQDLMLEGGFTRIEAIQLYCRMGKNLEKCLELLRKKAS